MWPYHIIKYTEDIALHFLALKHYSVEMALSAVMYEKDELINVIR